MDDDGGRCAGIGGAQGRDECGAVVDNSSASLGWPGGLAARFALEGWVTRDVDAADRTALVTALRATDAGAPTVVVVHTDPKTS